MQTLVHRPYVSHCSHAERDEFVCSHPLDSLRLTTYNISLTPCSSPYFAQTRWGLSLLTVLQMMNRRSWGPFRWCATREGVQAVYAEQSVCSTSPCRAAWQHVASLVSSLSQIFWYLTIIVLIKYVTFALRADDNGEGEPRCLAGTRCLFPWTMSQTAHFLTGQQEREEA